MGASAFEYFKTPFNYFSRWLLDDFMHTRTMYNTRPYTQASSRKSSSTRTWHSYILLQSNLLTTRTNCSGYTLGFARYGKRPLPNMHPHSQREMAADAKSQKPLLNIGRWGLVPTSYDEFTNVHRDLEQKFKELGGMKWLYAQKYYSAGEFWDLFNRGCYDSLREKNDANSLPNV